MKMVILIKPSTKKYQILPSFINGITSAITCGKKKNKNNDNKIPKNAPKNTAISTTLIFSFS